MAENVKVSKLSNLGKKISKFFKELKTEIKRIVWPTRKELVNHTITVMFFCLIIAVVIAAFDYVVGQIIFSWILKIK